MICCWSSLSRELSFLFSFTNNLMSFIWSAASLYLKSTSLLSWTASWWRRMRSCSECLYADSRLKRIFSKLWVLSSNPFYFMSRSECSFLICLHSVYITSFSSILLTNSADYSSLSWSYDLRVL